MLNDCYTRYLTFFSDDSSDGVLSTWEPGAVWQDREALDITHGQSGCAVHHSTTNATWIILLPTISF